jgi:hypothetical protein
MSFSRSGGTAPAFSFPIGVGTFTDVNASNTVFTSNVYSSFYHGDGGLLSNISGGSGPVYGNLISNINSSNVTQPFTNLVVSNALTVTNVSASGNVVIGFTPTSVQANLHVEQGNAFIGNSYWVGANSTNATIGGPTRLVFDNTTTPYAANKILLHSNTASANICGFGVVGVYNSVPITLAYYTSGDHSFAVGANQNFGGSTALAIRGTGAIDMNGNSRAKLDIGTFGTPASNTTVRIDGSNVALVTSGAGLVGFGTTTPTSNLQVVGNVYASNAFTTTNVTASGNVVIGPTPTSIQANLHVEQGSVFIGNSAVIGTTFTTTGSPNLLVFDNTSNNTVIPNKIVLFSNSIGNISAGTGIFNASSTGVSVAYYTKDAHYFYAGSTASPYCVGGFSSSSAFTIGSTPSSTNAKLWVTGGTTTSNIMARIDSSNVALATSGGGLVGISTLTPTANLHVVGNVYASNALQTTNLFANTLTLSNAAASITGNLYVSNAISTPQGYITNANVGTLNVASISNLASLTVPTANIVTLNVSSNVYAPSFTSNSSNITFNFDTINVPILYTTTINASSVSNLATIVTGNLYSSNALQTTNVICTAVNTVTPISFRNRVINGDFFIDQRNAGSNSTPTIDGKSPIDRWKINIVGAGRCLVGQNLGAIVSPTGFTTYFGMKVTTSNTVGPSDYFFISQVIEGVNIVDWLFGTAGAKTVTLSFWVYSSLTGTMGGFVRNSGTTGGNYTRSYPFTFSVSSATTWQYITVTIPGDTTGQWLATQTDGLEFGIELWNGTTYQNTASTWSAGNYTGPSGGTANFAGTLNSYMYVSGFQFEIGSSATPYERTLIDFQLAACQRYYEPTIVRVGGYNTSGANIRGSAYFNTKKRPATNPTFTVISTLESSNVGSLSFDNSNYDQSSARFFVPTTATGDAYGQWKVSVDAEF